VAKLELIILSIYVGNKKQNLPKINNKYLLTIAKKFPIFMNLNSNLFILNNLVPKEFMVLLFWISENIEIIKDHEIVSITIEHDSQKIKKKFVQNREDYCYAYEALQISNFLISLRFKDLKKLNSKVKEFIFESLKLDSNIIESISNILSFNIIVKKINDLIRFHPEAKFELSNSEITRILLDRFLNSEKGVVARYGKDKSLDKKFLHWLLSPDSLMPCLTNFVATLRNFRFDIVRAFPDTTKNFVNNINTWAHNYGINETGLDILLAEKYIKTISSRLNVSNQRKFFSNEINVFGYFDHTIGLGIAADSISKSLSSSKINIIRHPIPNTQSPKNKVLGNKYNQKSFLRGNVNIFVSNPQEYKEISRRFGFYSDDSLESTIGYWFWELDRPNQSMYVNKEFFKEIWVPNNFVKSSLEDLNKSIIDVGYPYKRILKNVKAQLKVENGEYFTTIFDYLSDIERKNPRAAIDSFNMVFNSKKFSNPKLIVKTINSDKCQSDALKLEKYVEGMKNVVILNDNWTRLDILKLIRNAVAYISLHRSEGLGLPLLEAMDLGVPNIATNYSANTEFMTKDNSCLVDFDLIETVNSKEVYQVNGAKWANPRIDNAAEYIYKLYKYPELRKEMAEKSIYAISRSDFIYSPKLFQNNVNERLNYLNQPPRFSKSKS
jgi:glycosyltransferase involved in cell wall biosynthesis